MTLNLEFFKKIKLPLNTKKTRATSVCFYSPSSLMVYEYRRQTIKPVSAAAKDSDLISYIPIEDIITETIDINKFLEGEELYEAIELKLFDELSLEPGLDYKICYEALPDTGDSLETRRYNAYVANHLTIRQRLAGISDRYVDFVFAPHSLIRTLFTKNFLSDSSTFAFIYLYNDNAYLCVYQNSNATYLRSLRGNIRTLTERFCEILGERIDAEDFVKIVVNSSFRTKKPEYEASFKTLIVEFFSTISDILMHAKRINQISGYEAIYIATEHGNIADIAEIAKEYFETPFRNFDFNLGIKTDGFVDMSSRLAIFAYLYDIKEYEHLNFSIFRRPPALLKRYAGKFIAASMIALILTCAYPLFNFTLASAYYSYSIKNLKKEQTQLDKEVSVYKDKIAALQKIETDLSQKIADEENKLKQTENLLQQLQQARSQTKSITARLINVSNVAANSRVAFRELNASFAPDIVQDDTLKDTAKTKTTKQELNNSIILSITCSAKAPNDITDFSKKLWLSNKLPTSDDSIQKDGNKTGYVGVISILDEYK